MEAKGEYRDRETTEVVVLDALVDRSEDGMTVFELRSHVDADIDRIEDALGELKRDGLIQVEGDGGRTLIYPDDEVVPDPGDDDGQASLLDWLREKLGP